MSDHLESRDGKLYINGQEVEVNVEPSVQHGPLYYPPGVMQAAVDEWLAEQSKLDPHIPVMPPPPSRDHPNCRCVWEQPPRWLLLTAGQRHQRLIYPTTEEAIGINLLDRDDQLNIRKVK